MADVWHGKWKIDFHNPPLVRTDRDWIRSMNMPLVDRSRIADESADLTVVILNDFCYVQGGASKVAIDEAVSLARAGVNVIFIGAVGPPSAELREAPLRVINLQQRELLDAAKHPVVILQNLWNVDACRRVRKELRALSAENTIVHLHGYTKALTAGPAKVAWEMGFRVICTLHDFFSACPNGAFFDYRKNQPCSRRALSMSCVTVNCDKRHYGHKIFRVTRGLIQRGYGAFPEIVEDYISLSRTSGEILKSYLPTNARIYALENAIDLDRPALVEAERNSEILYVGRLDHEKGVLLLADIAEKKGLNVTFVGDGPLRPRIEGRPGLTITGWVGKADVHRFLQTARCLVFPSAWYETYGLVVAESSAYGIPAIVSDVTAAAERVQDGLTGWHFRSGDEDDLSRCLSSIESDELVRRLGRAAYQAFWGNAPTTAVHIKGLLQIYAQALQRNADKSEN